MRKQTTLRKLTLAVLAAVLCVLLAVGGLALGEGTRTYADETGAVMTTPDGAHTGHVTVVYPATCVEPGLGLLVCEDEGCAEKGQSFTVVLPADGYSHKLGADNTCEICGKKVTAVYAAKSEGEEEYYEVSSVEEGAETKLIIPETFNGKPVKISSTGFQNNTTLEEVVIGNVGEIPAEAFKGCTALETVTLAEGLTSIGADAFENTKYYNDWKSSKEAYLYNGTYLLGVKAFEAPEAAAIDLEPAGDEAPIVTYMVKDGTTVIADGVMTEDATKKDEVAAVSLPASLVTIGANAFEGLAKLTAVDFDGLTALETIGKEAFKDTALASLDLSGLTALKTIGDSAFALASSEEEVEVVLPASLVTVGVNAFSTVKATELALPASLTSIGESAFAAMELETLALPEGLVELGNSAFAAAKPAALTLPDGLTKLGTSVVKTDELEYVVFGGELENIDFLSGLEGVKLYCTEEELPAAYGSLKAIPFSDDEPMVKGDFWHYKNNVPAVWHKIAAYQIEGLDEDAQTLFLVGQAFSTDKITVKVSFDDEETKTIALSTTKDEKGNLVGDGTHYTYSITPALDTPDAGYLDEDGNFTDKAIGTTFTVTLSYLYDTFGYTFIVRAATHKIAIDLNYELPEGEEAPEAVEVADNASYTLPTYTREKYTLKEWKVTIDEEPLEAPMKPGEKLEHVTEDVTIEAVWEVKTPNITVDLALGDDVSAEDAEAMKAQVTPNAAADNTEADRITKYIVTLTVSGELVREGYEFLGWTIEVNGKEVPLSETNTFDVDFADEMEVEIVANWAELFSISVTLDGHAKTNLSSEASYKADEEATFTVAADKGYKLVSVTANGTALTAENGVYTYTVKDGKNEIVITTAEIEVTVTVSGAPEGFTPEKAIDKAEGTVSVTNVPAQEGKKFTGWTVTVNGVDYTDYLTDGNTVTLTVANADIAVVYTANWVDVYAVTYTVNEGFEEHVTVAFDVAGPYTEGTVVTFTVTADAAYKVVSVKNGTATLTATDGKYSVTVAKAPIVIAIEIADNAFDVTLDVQGTDDVAENTAAFNEVTTGKKYNYGAKLTLTVGVADGYVVEVTVGTTKVELTAEKTYELTVTANTAVTVTFHKKTYATTSANLALDASKVTLTIGGTYAYYTKAEIEDLLKKLAVSFKEGEPLTALDPAPAAAVTTTDSEWTMSFDVTAFTKTYAVYFGDAQLKIAGQTAKDVYVDAADAGAKKYSLTFSADGAVSVGCTAVAKPTFTFDKGTGTGETAPTVSVLTACNANGYYTATLPANTYTAPAGKYFRGWKIGEIVYFEGEQYDALAGAAVTVSAVWEDLYVAESVTNNNAQITALTAAEKFRGYVYEGGKAEATAVLSAKGTVNEWNGFLTTVVVNGYTYNLRSDPAAFGSRGPNEAIVNTSTWETEDDVMYQSNVYTGVATKGTAEDYKGLFSDDDKVYQVATATLNQNVLTYTVTSYDSENRETGSEVYVTTFKLTSLAPIDHLILTFAIDDGDGNAIAFTETTYTGVELPNMSKEQELKAGECIEVGTVDNAHGYTDLPLWIGDLKKGEKVVLSGQMTTAGEQVWQGPLMFVYDEKYPDFCFRTDNFVLGNKSRGEGPLLSNHFELFNGWTVDSDGANTESTVAPVGDGRDNWWNGEKQLLSKADFVITFDYTGNKVVAKLEATGTGENDNKGKKFVVTYTITIPTALPEDLFIGLACDMSYVKITSLTRTSTKPTPAD